MIVDLSCRFVIIMAFSEKPESFLVKIHDEIADGGWLAFPPSPDAMPFPPSRGLGSELRPPAVRIMQARKYVLEYIQDAC